MREPKVISTRRVVTLMVVTAGLYALVWYYRANRELRDLGHRHRDELRDTQPGVALLAVTFGAFLLAPPFVSFLRFAGRLQRAEDLERGRGHGAGGLRALFVASLAISYVITFAPLPFGVIAGLIALHITVITTALALAQRRLNGIWEAARFAAPPRTARLLATGLAIE